MRVVLTLAILVLVIHGFKLKQENAENQKPFEKSITYKKIGDTNLKLHYFSFQKNEKIKPVIVFFHPGGWFSGSPSFFFEKAKEYSKLGYNTISVQYRLADFKTITPKHCLEDSIDALKFLNKNKGNLHLDMENLFLIGYSAGGHLALMSQLMNDTHTPTAKKIFTIASPVALIEDELLKRSTMTNSEKIKISPTNHIQNLNSKLYLFNGTKDEFIKYSSIETFMNRAKKFNKNVDLTTFKNGQHFLLSTNQKEIETKIKQEILRK